MQSGPFAERARRFAREIALAVVLTCAAAVFLFAALQRGVPETAAVAPPPDAVETQPN